MFDTGDFREHLLCRHTDHLLNFTRGGTGKWNKDIGEGDIDLRFFLTRCYQYRKNP